MQPCGLTQPPGQSRRRSRSGPANGAIGWRLALEGFDRVLREIEQLDEVMAEPIYDMHGWNQHMEDVLMDRR